MRSRQPNIKRDEHGVRHVHATSEPDLYRGLGWCHGRDRALQMLLSRLAGQGRLAEHLGADEELVEIDRAFRRLNLAGDALPETARMEPRDRRLVAAYCDGVNEALRRRVPWELRIAGLGRPAPWVPADCMLLARMAGWVALAQSQGEMERFIVDLVRAGVGTDLLEELFPGQLAGLDAEVLRELRPGEPLIPDAVRWNPSLPRMIASNNWVIAPQRTRSGRAILANDPHLEVGRLPAVWYEAAVRLEDRWCAAVTMPGLPALIAGRTNDLAWGVTYAFMDATDSWIEDCREGSCRRDVDGRQTWTPVRERSETIARAGATPLTVTFHETDHGVLDGDPHEPGLRLATRWATARGTGAASCAAFFEVFRARDVEAGRAALGRVEMAFNWVLADRAGNIGYQMSGLMPVRRPGATGLVPLPGWDPDNDWRGFADPADLPRAMNPPEGFIVTANQDLNELGRVHPQSLPMGDSRAVRIAELLSARTDWDWESVAGAQLDVASPHALRYLEILRPLLPAGANGDLLRDWDGTYPADSLAATLFERWYRALLTDVFGGVAGAEVMRHVLAETGLMADFFANFDHVLLSARSAWFGNERREDVYRRVAAAALAATPRPWGEEQRVTLRHLLLGDRPAARLGFNRGPIPLPGSRGTPRQGQVYRSGGHETSFAPSFRLVTDFAEPSTHTALAGGPSDRPFSRWYASGLGDWLAGRMKTVEP